MRKLADVLRDALATKNTQAAHRVPAGTKQARQMTQAKGAVVVGRSTTHTRTESRGR